MLRECDEKELEMWCVPTKQTLTDSNIDVERFAKECQKSCQNDDEHSQETII